MPELTKTFFEKILRDSERQELQVGDLIIFVKFSVPCSGLIFLYIFFVILFISGLMNTLCCQVTKVKVKDGREFGRHFCSEVMMMNCVIMMKTD